MYSNYFTNLEYGEIERMQEYIKKYFYNKRYSIIYDDLRDFHKSSVSRIDKDFFYNEILIENEAHFIHFQFSNYDSCWKLIHISRGEPQMDPPSDGG